MKLRLTCHEGFAFAGYQRIEVNLIGASAAAKKDIPSAIAEIMKRDEGPDAPTVYTVGNNLFVLSGESFTLADFAEAVQSGLNGLKVEYRDGDEGIYTDVD